jgi:hypothetical protein
MAVYGQTLLRLRDRGFKLVDVNYVSGPFARFGEEWVPQWKYEELMRQMMVERPAISDDRPAPVLPRRVAMLLPVSRLAEKVAAKFRSPYTPGVPPVATEVAKPVEQAEAADGAKPQAAEPKASPVRKGEPATAHQGRAA